MFADGSLIAPAIKKVPEKAPYSAPEGYAWKRFSKWERNLQGKIFIPETHERRHGKHYVNWLLAMEDYVGKPSRIYDFAGLDQEQVPHVKIYEDGRRFHYNLVRGWVLTKDGEAVWQLPEGFELQPTIPYTVGKAPTTYVEANEHGIWDFANAARVRNGLRVRLAPYAVHPREPSKEHPGMNTYFDHDDDQQTPRDLWGSYGVVSAHDSQAYGRESLYDSGFPAARVRLDDGRTVIWRIESLLTLVDHDDPIVTLRDELNTARSLLRTANDRISHLENQIENSTGRIDPKMRALYQSVQRLLTRYFLNGEVSTTDTDDARVFDNLVQRYRAARLSVHTARSQAAGSTNAIPPEDHAGEEDVVDPIPD